MKSAVIITAIVGVLALCTWFAVYYFEKYLSTPHTYGKAQIIPYGHNQKHVLTHSWDSIQVQFEDNVFILRDIDIDITLFGDSKGLKFNTGELCVSIKSKEKTDSSKKSIDKPIAIPDEVQFYIPVDININKAIVHLDTSKHWQANKISVQSIGAKSAFVSLDSLKGDYLAKTASLKLDAHWSNQNASLNGKFIAQNDSIEFKVQSPKDNLVAVKTTSSVNVEDIEQWLPFEIPKEVPSIGKVKLQSEVYLDAKSKNPIYDISLQTRIGEFWPLKKLNVNVRVKGDIEKFHTDILLKDDEGGSISLKADLNDKLDGTASGKVENMSALFGPQMMPMDMTIHSAVKKGNKIKAKVETRQGSNVEANIDFDSDVPVTYVGDMSPYEPWALDWSKGELVLKERFSVYGTVFDGKTRIFVKIPNIPYAYHVKADSLQTVLLINKDGIDFSEGIIYSPKEIYDFTGDVVWNGIPHTSWELTQRSGGHAKAYISIIDSTTMNIETDNIEVSTVPFANFQLNEKLNGKISGKWTQNFDLNVGEASISFDGNFDPFQIQGKIDVHENGDTIFIDNAEATQSQNKVQAEAVFILPNDSNPSFNPTATLPIQILHAWASSEKFNIPLLLDPINDTTFKSGYLNGDIAYNEDRGLQGNIEFTDIEFNKISPNLFNIKKMNLFAEGSKIELNAYLGIGGGGWTGNSQVILDNIFDSKRHISISHNTDNGGNLWAEGFIDSLLVFTGKMNMNGSWFIPGTISEIKKTDLKADITANIKEGLAGIVADFRTDSTYYQPPKLNYQFPIHLRGHLEKGILDVTEASTQNDSSEKISATIKYNLNDGLLQAIDFESDKYSLRTKRHTLVIKDLVGHLENSEDNLIISASIPSLAYQFNDETFGTANALGSSNLNLLIPHSQDDLIQNKTISGDVIIDKLVYNKKLDIEITPNSIDKLLTLFNNFINRLRKSEAVESKISTASPINLALHLYDSQKDSIDIVTPFAEFPFTFDILVLGNTTRPLLRGDISNSNNGFIGVKDLYVFDLNSFRISWSDVPWQHGVIDITSSQELPYCNETEENETCPINLDIQGTITNPQPTPSSNCGNESSSAAIYYNIFLGCITENTDENTDWNKLAGIAIGKVLSSTANRTLGGEYIGDIDMKVMLFNNNTSSEKDSSYIKLPVSLDRWVKDLSLVFGYTQDQSENPTYDQSLQFGVNYTLPVFQGKEFSHKNHLSPTLSLNGQLISKQYLTNTGTQTNENRIEKNIGLNYTYRYWNPCLLGIGNCETYQNLENSKSTTGDKK